MSDVAVNRLDVSCSGRAFTVEEAISQKMGNASFEKLTAPTIALRFNYAAVGGFSIWNLKSDSGYVCRSENEEDAFVLAGVRSGNFRRFKRNRQLIVADEPISLLRTNDTTSSFIQPGTDFLATRIYRADLRRRLNVFTGGDPVPMIDFPTSIPRDSPAAHAMMSLLRTMEQALLIDGGLVNAPFTIAALEDMLLSAIVEIYPNTLRFRTLEPAEDQAVRRARDYILAHVAQPLRVEEIAAVSGISLRSLQIAFRRSVGQTLTGYIQSCRLERARRDIEDPERDDLIKVIAYRWGFVHLSAFASRYYATYGERPSDTRRRVQDRIVGLKRWI